MRAREIAASASDTRLQCVTLACGLVSLGALAAVVVLVRFPPLLDYPNHLARLWLLAGGAKQAPLSAMYSVDWSGASTNLGVDLLGATLGRVMEIAAIGHLLVGAALLLPVLGAMVFHRALFGGWHWWQVGFATLAWNSTFLAGFLNFQIGLGLALLAAAAEPVLARRTGPIGAACARAVLGCALLVCHVFAAAFYGILVGALAFGSDGSNFGSARRLARSVPRSVAAAMAAFGLPLLVLALAAPNLPGSHAPAGLSDPAAGYTVLNKMLTLASVFVTYDARLDAIAVLALWTIWRSAARRAPHAHRGLLVAAAGLLALAVVSPSTLAGTAFVDWRFSAMALLTAVAAVRPRECHHPNREVAAACALMLLSVARTAWVAGIWDERQADVTAVERALEAVPAGAAVLPAQQEVLSDEPPPRGRYLIGGLPSFWHYPALAVPERHAFVPTLFAARGKQPLRVLPPWDAIAVPEGVPAPLQSLRSFKPSALNMFAFGYVANWRRDFDYVLLVNADLAPVSAESSVPELALVADEGFARLYRIRRNGADAPADRSPM